MHSEATLTRFIQGQRMASKPPDAFLSYTRFDDEYHGGAISDFCRRLANAVRAITGYPFEIFQDVEGIGVGEHWPGKLDAMLSEVRFFIPILTPNYFMSKPCLEELEKFLRAEAERGRKDLILPIYYIECDVLEDDDLRAGSPLAGTLHERERQDWRELRFESFDAGNVRRALERLARDIVKARRRLGPPRPIQDAPWCPELVVIPPGEFVMGSDEAERRWAVEHDAQWEWVDNEQPRHRVEIAYPLAVGRFPVTFAQYDRFARITRRDEPGDEGWGRGRRPVIKVSWEDAKAYVNWLAAETGQPYRLLSEAEWEYACRAGAATRFWWGDEIAPENANYGRNVGKTVEVGTHRANRWGLYDTHGNVWEWVEDCWNDRYDGAPADGSAWTSGDCSHRVMRGGSWKNKIWDLRSAKRFKMRASEWINDFGFRVAKTLTS